MFISKVVVFSFSFLFIQEREGNKKGQRATYADTPTISRILAVLTMDVASVNPKLYVHGCTGTPPAPMIALIKVVTCVASCMPTAFNAVIWEELKPAAVKSASANLANP